MIIKLKPTRVFRTYFGGKNIDRLMGKPNAENSRFPEDWLGSVTKAFNPGREVENEGLTLTSDGRILRDVIEADKLKMIGKRDKMTLLFKLLDAAERLVIQAHPTNEFARKHFNSEFGKTECWYVLNDGGYVYIGFKEGITKDYWKNFFEKQDVEGMIACLHRFEVKKGDFIFVPGGVPHAIGKGCFIAELQEPSDLMVIPEKVTPSGVELAEQKLHGGLGFEDMFNCFLYEGLSVEAAYEKFFRKPVHMCDNIDIIVDDSVTDKFSLWKINVCGEYELNIPSYGICVITDGHGKLNSVKFSAGDRFFVSESQKNIAIIGDAEMLICMP